MNEAILRQIESKLVYLDYGLRSTVVGDLASVLKGYKCEQIKNEISTNVDNSFYYMNEYLNYCKVQGMKDGTLYNKKNALLQFMSYSGKPFDKVNNFDVIGFIAYKINNGTKKSTIQNFYKAISTYFDWLVEIDAIKKNPVKNVRRIKDTKDYQKEVVPFTKPEIETLKQFSDKRQLAMIEFLISTGCRVNETANVKISDVDFDKKQIHLRITKNGKPRTVFLTDVAVMRIKEYLESRKGNSEYLFCKKRSPFGMLTTNSIQSDFKTLESISGVPDVHPHKFRHTFCTNCLDRGIPVQIVKELMGHNSIQTTMRYTHTTKKQLQNQFENYMN